MGDIVHHFKLTDFEHGTQHGSLQTTSPCHSLVSIQGATQLLRLQTELGPDQALEKWHPACATHDLHCADLLHRDRRPIHSPIQHRLDLAHHGLAHLLKIVPVNLGTEVLVVHQHLHIGCGLKVGAQDLFGLSGGVFKLKPRLAVGQRVALVLLLESGCKIFHQTPVHVPSTAIAVAGG
mmetsp:Transcript_47153/g.102626  ORF Transcript_47153/g.102626 Transcript_47153/m.102626 type:complete len:179 (+) Transcript_47153:1980-2516(+)